MKKLAVFALAALLVVAFTVPASALENEFGGYWRTRAFMQKNFDGEDVASTQDVTRVDTRSRIYYTAKINDNLKFVNKFEFNSVWGDTVGGDIGADGNTLVVKNSYADFNYADMNFKVGIQGRVLARGIIFDDDFSGAVVTYKGDGFQIPFIWMKAYEGGTVDTADVDYYAVAPSFNLSDAMTITPYVLYVKSGDANSWAAGGMAGYDTVDLYYLGVDFDAKFDAASVWFTGIYETGSADVIATGNSDDVSAYVFTVGAGYDLDAMNLHGQIFYASGQDLTSTSTDQEAFFVPAGQSYYWAEIMGLGILDNQASAGSCGDTVSNLIAYNLGASFKAMDNVTLKADLWYAELAEDNAAGDTDLGTEFDLVATVKLMDNLNLDLVGAYLFAGDATYKGADDADPYEIGSRLSLSF
ncbi:MAG: hypothetical protein PHP23_11730 [Desulfobacterales bacterium]|nr:hypothetical protein [Desulfobacterales bacterium]MDD4072987.1 hypothetical protein [Desulfobacterales bacterium]MDD4392861.1 hypothetical protein [Desulfobacterales bacterium]